MTLYIVSWNILGQYSIRQILDRFVENSWSLLFVLEPSRTTSVIDSQLGPQMGSFNLAVVVVGVGQENVVVVYDTLEITSFNYQAVTILSGQRKAVQVDVTTSGGMSYRILSTHAPYQNNSGIAAQYQRALVAYAQKNGVDIIVGDLNTYGNSLGSKRQNINYQILTGDAPTSRGGHPLDKAIMKSDKYYGAGVHADKLEDMEIEIPSETFFPTGSRASSRQSTQSSYMGLKKQSDHQPIFLSAPSLKLHKDPVSKSLHSKIPAAGNIIGDGHCLYRCLAVYVYGDQNQYQKIRDALADYVLQHGANYAAFVPAFANQGDRQVYAHVVRNTATWGGELEIRLLADLYNLTIHLYSHQGYQQALYGTGATVLDIFHNGNHFYL